MAITLAPDLATSVLEGDALRFTFLKEASDPAEFSIRWVITPAGYLPLSPDSSIESFTGTVDFTASDSTYHFDLETIKAATSAGLRRSFDIEFFVVDPADSTGASDTLIEKVSRQIEDSDAPPDLPHNLNSTEETNTLVLGTLYDIPEVNGGPGDDTFYITQYHYSDITLFDTAGINTIVLDYGVEITDVAEVNDDLSGTGLSIEQLIQFGFLPPGSTSFIVIAGVSVSFTLSTGATITLASPAGENYLFQIGDGEALSYYDVRDQFVGATTDDPFIVDSIGDLPDSLPETRPTDTINVITSEVDDVVTGGEYDIPEANGGPGQDYLIISKYLTSDVTLFDTAGINTIVLDYGVEITDVAEVNDDLSGTGLSIEQLIQFGFLPPGSTSFIVIAGVSVSFTLSTGAMMWCTITLASPAGENYLFQIGGGEALNYYDVREQFVGATTDDPFIVPLPEAGPPPVFTLPDTGATYFRYDTSAADAQDHGFYRFTPNATASLDDDTRDNAKLVDTDPGYDVANLIILDGEIDRDYASNQALTGGGGDDIFRLDLATIGDGKASGALTLNLRDFSGDNILHLIADGDGANLITGIDYNAVTRLMTLTITAPDGADAGEDRDPVAEIVLNTLNFDIYVGETLVGADAGLTLDDLPATVALEVV